MSHLSLAGVSKRYGRQAALERVDLDVPSGSRMAILGPSGCGKTTLLRIIAGFEGPDEGSVALDGEALAGPGFALPPHRRHIGLVMQDGALFPHLNVGGNVGFGIDGVAAARRARIGDLMDLVGLPASMVERRPDQLSGGQQQRVALARALAREPRLMLLDEPFSALDAGLRAATRDTVAALLTAQGVTTVLVTHDQDEALGFADLVAVMRGGRVRRVGTPRDVYLRPGDAEVATFLGGAVLIDADMAGDRAVCGLGTLPVDDVGRLGRVRLMLRPEQIRLVPHGTVGSTTGLVLTSCFSGPAATVRVRLDAMRDAEPVTISVPGFGAPEAGQRITVAVDGLAHVLDG